MYANLGETFANIRKRRGFSIDEIRGAKSKSSVSRFENGITSLDTSSLRTLFQNIHSSLNEGMAYDASTVPYLDVWSEIEKAETYEKGELLTPLITNLEKSNDPMDKLMTALLKGYQCLLFGHDELTENALSPLLTYLLGDGPWYELEFQLFSVVVYLAPRNIRIKLIRVACEKITNNPRGNLERPLIIGLYNAAVKAVEQTDYKMADFLFGTLRSVSDNVTTLFMKYRIKLIELALQWMYDHDETVKTQLINMNATIDLIGAHSYAAADREWLTKLGIDGFANSEKQSK
jgi:transcriptional regulator with XRE-family HTH domain